MQLRDGVLAVRQRIGELEPNFFTDYEIVLELNTAAKDMCSEAQSIQAVEQFTTTQVEDETWAQEYILPSNVDQVLAVSYFQGALFPLKYANRSDLQVGGYVPGLPQCFYLNTKTQFLSPQIAGGSINVQPMNPNTAQQGNIVLGLWPVPAQETPIYVWYLAFHPEMINPLDWCLIPSRFKKAWTSYAIARMKEKAEALDAAKYYDAQYEEGKLKYIEYMQTNGQELSPPTFSNSPSTYANLRGSSVMLVVAQNPGVSNM